MAHLTHERTLVLFNYDFDRIAHRPLEAMWPMVSAGFDLFAFPSQLRLAWFDIERFAALQALRAQAQGCRAVVSHHEHFGALSAALVAERLRWPGTPVRAVLACQHKFYARQVLQQVCPEANIPSARWVPRTPVGAQAQGMQSLAASSDAPDQGLTYPIFAKPIKAAFSVLAREIRNDEDFRRLLQFGWWESTVLRLLVQPFERVVRSRLPEAGSAVGMMLERPVQASQFNLDGYVFEAEVQPLGVVDAVMYPGTRAFMRFDYPTRLPARVVRRATNVAQRFLDAVGFNHGLFNMEFFYDEASDALTVIEFNPRMASQFSDLYERVEGINLHEIGLCLANGQNPAKLARKAPTAAVASSFVYRSFPGRKTVELPNREQRELLRSAYPDSLLLDYPHTQAGVDRDHKWLGSSRHGILHLGAEDAQDLERRCELASRLLGWTPTYAQWHAPLQDRPFAAPPSTLVDEAMETTLSSPRSLSA